MTYGKEKSEKTERCIKRTDSVVQATVPPCRQFTDLHMELHLGIRG
jgi:hypothetical protein